MCHVIADVHELGSFIIHGEAAVQLFSGELECLNVFGPNTDEYLLTTPLLRAMVHIINPDLPGAVPHNP